MEYHEGISINGVKKLLGGNVYPDNFNKIREYFNGRENLSFLEVGTLEGRTTVWLLDNILTDSKSRIHCVDPFIEKMDYIICIFMEIR